MTDSIIWTGQVNFTDSSDVGTTGVATLTLTPDIGITNLPALVSGDPGLPPVLRNITVNQVAAGTTPPASSFVLVTAGGPGVASVYDLTLYVNSGAAGATGASGSISTALDVTGTLTNKYILVYDSSQSKWVVSPQLCGDIYAPTSYSSYSGNAAMAQIALMSIPAQPFDWRPDVAGFAISTGTNNTRVELTASLINPVTSALDTVGYAPGTAGAGPNVLTLTRAFASPPGSGSFGRVPAGSSASIAFSARQIGSTTDSWAVNGSTANFSVKVNPIP